MKHLDLTKDFLVANAALNLACSYILQYSDPEDLSDSPTPEELLTLFAKKAAELVDNYSDEQIADILQVVKHAKQNVDEAEYWGTVVSIKISDAN